MEGVEELSSWVCRQRTLVNGAEIGVALSREKINVAILLLMTTKDLEDLRLTIGARVELTHLRRQFLEGSLEIGNDPNKSNNNNNNDNDEISLRDNAKKEVGGEEDDNRQQVENNNNNNNNNDDDDDDDVSPRARPVAKAVCEYIDVDAMEDDDDDDDDETTRWRTASLLVILFLPNPNPISPPTWFSFQGRSIPIPSTDRTGNASGRL